jgi:hypothetical protein
MQPMTEALHHLGLAFQFSNDVSLLSNEGLMLDIQNRTSSLPLILLAERLRAQDVDMHWDILLSDEGRLFDLMAKNSIPSAVAKMVEDHLRVFRHKMRVVNPDLEAHCDLLIAQVCASSAKTSV